MYQPNTSILCGGLVLLKLTMSKVGPAGEEGLICLPHSKSPFLFLRQRPHSPPRMALIHELKSFSHTTVPYPPPKYLGLKGCATNLGKCFFGGNGGCSLIYLTGTKILLDARRCGNSRNYQCLHVLTQSPHSNSMKESLCC